MAESIVAGLFGLTPSQVNRQSIAEQDARALQYAQLDPFERANMGMYQAGGNIARIGGGLLGMKTGPQQEAEQAQNIQQQIDHSTPEGLLEGARKFNQAGNPRMAMMYQQAADAKRAELANIALKQAQEQKALAEARRAGKEEDMAKYSRAQVVEVGVEGKPDYRQKGLYDPLTKEFTPLRAPYRVTAAITAEAKQLSVDENRENKKRLAEDAVDASMQKSGLIVGTIKEAIGKVNVLSSGFIGETTGVVPGTPGYNLQATIDPIIANLGFKELQDMRAASPTGGALGQVAVKELEMLQSTVASFKKGQSPEQLKANLKKALNHYKNWIDVMIKAYPDKAQKYGQVLNDIEESANEVKTPKVQVPAGDSGWKIRLKK